MSEYKYYICKIRARNSSLGRAKEIHFTSESNNPLDLSEMLKDINRNAHTYFNQYGLPGFYPDLLVYNKVIYHRYFMEEHIPYIQGTVFSTTTKYPDNYFKTYEEVEDYMMKYFFTSSVEYTFFKYIKRHKEQAEKRIPYYAKALSDLETYMAILKKYGVVDLKAEYEKYIKTGRSDLPIILYSNWKKYKENKDWIKGAIFRSQNKYI